MTNSLTCRDTHVTQDLVAHRAQPLSPTSSSKLCKFYCHPS